MPGMADASLHPAVLRLHDGPRGRHRPDLRRRSGHRGDPRQHRHDAEGRQHARLRRTRHGPDARTLVIVETALALMLLVGAGLLIKSFARLTDVDPGFSTENVLTAQLSLPATRYADAPLALGVLEAPGRKGAAMPGVTPVGLTSNVPFNGNVSSGSYAIVGYTPGAGEAAATRPAGGRRRRLLQGDADSAASRGGSSTTATPPTARPWSSSIKYLADQYFAEAQRDRSADSPRRSASAALHDRRRRRDDQQHRSRACRSRKSVSTIRSRSSRARRWRWC